MRTLLFQKTILIYSGLFVSILFLMSCGGSDDLKSRVGTLPGSPSTSANLQNARERNKNIKNLKIRKDTEKGVLSIKFDFNNPGCPSCRFLISLFDKNGKYQSGFPTEEHFRLFEMEQLKSKMKHEVHLDFPVNLRDLKEVSAVEFGFSPD